MIIIKTMKQIATSDGIRSSRSLPRLSGLTFESSDRARIITAREQIKFQQVRRQWLIQQTKKR